MFTATLNVAILSLLRRLRFFFVTVIAHGRTA
jgi:hypothetical protein